MAEFSSAYRDALADAKAHHLASKTYSGSLALPHAPYIKALIEKHDVKTVLDYGCGKGIQYSEPDPDIGQTLDDYWGVKVAKYDPAWKPYAAEPKGTYDLVICTHVLGSIPLEDIEVVVDRLYALATKAVYIGELIGPVKKTVFRNPERLVGGLQPNEWVPILARDSALDAVFAYRMNGEGGDKMKFVRLTDR